MPAFQQIRPWKLFPLFLLAMFAVEWAVMAGLRKILEVDSSSIVFSLMDSALLTLLLAPLAWWMFVVPLQRLLELRTVLLQQVIEAQEEERGRIARDLHDSVGQSLTSLMVGLRAFEETTDQPAAKKIARELRDQGALAHEELRRMVRALKPYQLDELGLLAAIERDLEALQQQQDVEVVFSRPAPSTKRRNTTAETAAYRVFQEAVNNAIRHGKPRFLQVSVLDKPEGLLLEVKDDGSGFDTHSVWRLSGKGHPFGLLSMRERVALLGGTMEIKSKPGVGTVVSANFPGEYQDKFYG